MNNEAGVFGTSFRNMGRAIELLNHFLDKRVEITLRNEQKIIGQLNIFNEHYVIVDGKHIINLRYVMNISIID